ncbi:MAG: polysaccharide deacetylase family protein [Firmicutes bacterium]|nr:polysaccharide deacetylase family protein [Bacillota bacterium]
MFRQWIRPAAAIFLTATAVAAVVFLLYSTFTRAPGPAAGAAAPAVEKGPEKKVAVLLFHAIDPDRTNPNAMRPEELEATFQAMKECGYRPISLDQFHGFIDGRTGVPEKAVLITFDDGYRDVYTYALPLTLRYRYPAVLFAITKWFDPGHRPEPARKHLSAGEAGALIRSGQWALGGHGYEGHRMIAGGNYTTGPYYLTRAWIDRQNRVETGDEYRRRVLEDLIRDRAWLEMAGGGGAPDFAYPFGAWNSDLVELCQKAGYVYLYTNKPGLVTAGQDRTAIPRITAGHGSYETLALLAWYFNCPGDR